jgi:tRNA dimethylallyltransferase
LTPPRTAPSAPLPPAILLAGPTASGKTAIALDLAERLPLEIVSVDSAQVFIDMNVGTAKPEPETLARFPHHLIDRVTPEESYSAGRFVAEALAAMADIRARGKVPLLVGGTMLYFKALCEGIADLPPADPALRAQIEAEAAERGWPALHAELAQRDPAAAARIDPNHSSRLQRALELTRLTGQTLDALYAAGRAAPPPWAFLKLALLPAREVLHERIAQRFRAMLAAGLDEELEGLRRRYLLTPEMTSMRCVGYRQMWDYQDGRIGRAAMEAQGIAATRQLAKRQFTWLRSLPGYENFDPLQGDCTQRIDELIRRHLAAHL